MPTKIAGLAILIAASAMVLINSNALLAIQVSLKHTRELVVSTLARGVSMATILLSHAQQIQ